MKVQITKSKMHGEDRNIVGCEIGELTKMVNCICSVLDSVPRRGPKSYHEVYAPEDITNTVREFGSTSAYIGASVYDFRAVKEA